MVYIEYKYMCFGDILNHYQWFSRSGQKVKNMWEFHILSHVTLIGKIDIFCFLEIKKILYVLKYQEKLKDEGKVGKISYKIYPGQRINILNTLSAPTNA